jgi:hypothetical protein
VSVFETLEHSLRIDIDLGIWKVRSCVGNNQVQTLSTNQGAVKFIGCSFWGPSHAVAVVDGTGTMSFIGCHFEDWDNQLNSTATGFVHNGTVVIDQRGGNLVVRSCSCKPSDL